MAASMSELSCELSGGSSPAWFPFKFEVGSTGQNQHQLRAGLALW
jgi:hypothetical protein